MSDHRLRTSFSVAAAILPLLSEPAFAHSTGPSLGVGAQTDESYALLLLTATLVLYCGGVARLWRRCAPGHGITLRQVAAFFAGWLVLAAALISPLALLSRGFFSAHMLEHELIIAVAAPLLVMSLPLIAFLWVLPARARRALTAEQPRRLSFRMWWLLTASFVAWLLHGLVLWLWHVPSVFDAAMDYPPVHALQHLSFLGAGVIYWWSLLNGGAQKSGGAILSLFASSMHGSALGALMTLSPRPWYTNYITVGGSAALSPLADQQIAGLIMWVPAGVIYTAAGLLLAARWLREAERRVRRWESATPRVVRGWSPP
jgi:cytochrome c oxidase assembly factor CtaG